MILCVADETDPLVYSPSSKRLFGDCDIVISAGDLPLRYYDFIMTIMGKQLFYVYGNHNLEQFKESMLKVSPASQVIGNRSGGLRNLYHVFYIISKDMVGM